MTVSPPKNYYHTNERQMYGRQSTQALLSYKEETNVWQSVHPSLTIIQIIDTCMTVSQPMPYCGTNKRHMYGSAVHPNLTVVQIRDKCMAVQSTLASLLYICLLYYYSWLHLRDISVYF